MDNVFCVRGNVRVVTMTNGWRLLKVMWYHKNEIRKHMLEAEHRHKRERIVAWEEQPNQSWGQFIDPAHCFISLTKGLRPGSQSL